MTLMSHYRALQNDQAALRLEVLRRCETQHNEATQEDRQLFLANELLKRESDKVRRIKILRHSLNLGLGTAKQLDDLIEWANHSRSL